MDVSRVSLRRYSIVICMKMRCRARNVMRFAAQAQRFVRSADCCGVPLGLAFGESRVFGVLDVAVPLGFAFQGVASKLCFRDKSQLKCRFWWMGVCSERVEIIPNVWWGANFVEAHMRRHCHFSWQAQYFVRLLRCGSAILVAGAGNREVARCGGGDISWQAQYFVRVRRVDAERFVAGAGNREVVSCGRGECRCHRCRCATRGWRDPWSWSH